MALRSKETLFNAALYSTGNTPADRSGLWEALEANYDEIVREAFERGGPSLPFGRTRKALTSRANGQRGYDDMFTFGVDVMHIIEVFLDERAASDLLLDWEIDAADRKLLINASNRTVEIEYIRVGQEHTWSATFARGVQKMLESVIKSVLEEEEEAAAKASEGDLKLLMAGTKGSKNRSNRRVFKRGGGRIMRARSTSPRRR